MNVVNNIVLRFIPELNDKQLDRLSEFLSNFSLLILATLVLPNIIGVDKPATTLWKRSQRRGKK